MNTISAYATKQIEDEIREVLHKNIAVQKERTEMIQRMEQRGLLVRRLDEIKIFISENNPLQKFDEDLFRKLIFKVIIHNRNEIEFVFKIGLNKKATIRDDACKTN